ncbi:hypothetical protein COB72_00190 [bacterium]|nr:MAG: hypothetical protein COB72_00190 [bacterium]
MYRQLPVPSFCLEALRICDPIKAVSMWLRLQQPARTSTDKATCTLVLLFQNTIVVVNGNESTNLVDAFNKRER